MICNRCQLTKVESEKLFEQYMKNLMNYVKLNEMFHNQMIVNTNNVTNNKIRKDNSEDKKLYYDNLFNQYSVNGNFGNSK